MVSYPAYYTDGKTGERQDVTVELGPAALHVTDRRGGSVADWPYGQLRLVEEVYAGQPVRLKEGRKGAARLTVDDHTILDALPAAAGHLRRRDYRRSSSVRRAAVWIAALAAVVAIFLYGLPIVAGPIASLIPLKWEEALGRSVRDQALALFASKARTCRGEAGQRALERLVGRLSATVPSRYTFRIVVVDSKIVNAFAAPGGYIVVFRGLIDKTPSADGLAGVLAHEMGHVVKRHGTQALIKVVGLGLVLSFLGGDTSSANGAAAGIARDLLTKSYSRDAERQADGVAVTMLNRAGIRGDGFMRFFQIIAGKQAKQDGVSSFFATHPPSRDRAETIRRTATGTGPAMTGEEWRAVRAICR